MAMTDEEIVRLRTMRAHIKGIDPKSPSGLGRQRAALNICDQLLKSHQTMEQRIAAAVPPTVPAVSLSHGEGVGARLGNKGEGS
jgi:hypothetical protein